MLRKYSRGAVYFYNFGESEDRDGSVEFKTRPCVIVSNNENNKFSKTVIVAPITTRPENEAKHYQVYFCNFGRDQVILCEQLRCVNVDKLMTYKGQLDDVIMRKVDEALAIQLGLNTCEKELNANEFINRLDLTLKNIIASRLENSNNNDITKLIQIVRESEERQEKMIQNFLSNINTDDYKLLINKVDEIQQLHNENKKSLNSILNSLIALYKNINVSSNIAPIDIKEETPAESLKKDIEVKPINDASNSNKKQKSIKPKYTLDYAIAMLTDYYKMNRQDFMSKYDIKDKIMCNNRVAKMRSILKDNGVDYTTIKDGVVVYNINDLTKEEQTKFTKYLKNGKNTTETKIQKSLAEPETYVAPNREFKGVPGCNKGCKKKTKLRKFDYSIENCLAFINEWNNTICEDMCKKYNVSAKQLTNRKYLICKWLIEHNIEFKVTDKRRESSGRR